jgi:RHS repeat-associated protein
VTARYTNGPGVLGALYTKNQFDVHTYFLKDALGSVAQLTDDGGTVQESYAYDVFGAKRSAVVIDDRGVQRAFTGKHLDARSGLLNFGSRLYDATTGRFITADAFTWGPDDARGIQDTRLQAVIVEVSGRAPMLQNIFAYLMNNPVSDIDNDGFAGFWWDLLIIVASVLVAVLAIIAAAPVVALTAAGTFLLWVGIGLGVAGIVSAVIWGNPTDVGLGIAAFAVALLGLWFTSLLATVILSALAIGLAFWAFSIWWDSSSGSGIFKTGSIREPWRRLDPESEPWWEPDGWGAPGEPALAR